MAVAITKASLAIPITTELLLDGGWEKAYPTWADAESTPMWQFEDEVMFIRPAWDFEARLEWAEDADDFNPKDLWLDDDDEEGSRGRLARLIDRVFKGDQGACECINCRDESDD